jgi:hypothetical protein
LQALELKPSFNEGVWQKVDDILGNKPAGPERF